MPPGIHAHSGWFFVRLPNGSVEMCQRVNNANVDKIVVPPVVFSKECWATIVSSMSLAGEGNYRYYRALEFHEEAEG